MPKNGLERSLVVWQLFTGLLVLWYFLELKPQQWVVFVVVSFVLLFFTRPFAAKYVNKNTVKTNSESLIGEKARVTAEINNEAGTGTAVVNGQEWTARSMDESKIYPVGTTVAIKDISGVKLIVCEIGEER